jgi:hypothetical protein
MPNRCLSRGDQFLAQLKRRREAAQRLPGGDPLSPAERALDRVPRYPRPAYALTPKRLDGAVDAVTHLMALGLTPLMDTATLRALWRRGDRELAERLARFRGAA